MATPTISVPINPALRQDGGNVDMTSEQKDSFRDYIGASNGANVNFLPEGPEAEEVTVQTKLRQAPARPSEFPTLAKATTAAHEGGAEIHLDKVVYSTTETHNIPPDTSAEFRMRPLKFTGRGFGEPFIAEDVQEATVLTTTSTTAPAVNIRHRLAMQGAGSIDFGGVYISSTGDDGVPSLKIEGLQGVNHIHDFVVLQKGVGDGVQAGNTTTSSIDDFHTLNSDWPKNDAVFTGSLTAGVLTVTDLMDGLVQVGQVLTGSGVTADTTITAVLTGDGGVGTYSTSGSQTLTSRTLYGDHPRTGVGYSQEPDQDHGLGTVRHGTSRGWAQGWQFGNIGSGLRLFACAASYIESSACRNGVRLTSQTASFLLNTPYAEGISGTSYLDEGQGNYLLNLHAVLQFTVGVDLQGDGVTMSGGYIGLRKTGATGIRIKGSPYGTNVLGAHIVWGGAGLGGSATGVLLQPAEDPPVNLQVSFNPPGSWTGGAKITDQTYSSAHGGASFAVGSGVFGQMTRVTGNQQQIPALSRGAINLHVDGQAITNPYIDGSGTCSLSNASVQYVVLSSAAVINRFVAPNLPDKTGVLLINNGNLTINPTAYIEGIAAPIVLGPGEEANVIYQNVPGGNGVVRIISVQYVRKTAKMPSYTVAQLASVTEGVAGPVLASNGRRSGEAGGAGTGCPVWNDGTNWRTFYDNSVVAA